MFSAVYSKNGKQIHSLFCLCLFPGKIPSGKIPGWGFGGWVWILIPAPTFFFHLLHSLATSSYSDTKICYLFFYLIPFWWISICLFILILLSFSQCFYQSFMSNHSVPIASFSTNYSYYTCRGERSCNNE